jgi:hypothetical protein
MRKGNLFMGCILFIYGLFNGAVSKSGWTPATWND